MTSFTGYRLFDQSDFTVVPVPDAVAPHDHPIPAAIYQLEDLAQLKEGPLTNEQPLGLLNRSFLGWKIKSFADDFYNQIYIIPRIINFGTVVVDEARLVTIWNAYLTTQTIDTITDLPDQGVTVAGATTPDAFPPLVSQDLTVTATALGPPIIDGDIIFTFAGLGDFPLRVLGFRFALPGIPNLLDGLPPDWKQATYRVTREYKTDLFVSRSGKEQRRALRDRPRKRVEFSSTRNGVNLASFRMLMEARNRIPITLPDYSRSTTSTANVPVGASTMPVMATPNWAVLGASVQLKYQDTSTVMQIRSAAAGVITFISLMTQPWPQGTTLRPLLTGRLTQDVSTTRLTNATGKIDVVFDVTPGSEPEIEPPAAATTFNGREVFLKSPNWANEPTMTFTDPFETLDYGQGFIDYFDPVPFNTMAQEATYVAKTPAEAEELEAFFDRMKGRRGEFYMPTGAPDLLLRSAMAATDVEMRVKGADVNTVYAGSTVFKCLAVMNNDGTWIFAKVLTMSTISDDIGDDTLIVLTAPIGEAIDPTSIAMVCWMPVWTFVSDTLVSEWLTDGVAQFQLTHHTVEDSTAE